MGFSEDFMSRLYGASNGSGPVQSEGIKIELNGEFTDSFFTGYLKWTV